MFDDLNLLTLRVSLVVHRPRPYLDKTSRERCQRISDLPEIKRRFPRLSTEEFLRNVRLLLARVAVELVDALLEMGMDISLCSLVFPRSLLFS